MAISTVTVSVSGTIDLDLTYANGYELNADGLGPGTLTERREFVTGPFTRHRWLIDTQRDTSTAPLDVFVFGSTASSFNTRAAALIAAFKQFSYNLQVTIDGVLYEWVCEPADIAPGADGKLDFWDLGAFSQVFHLSIPRDPVPVNGAF